jgi:hypothetical protein
MYSTKLWLDGVYEKNTHVLSVTLPVLSFLKPSVSQPFATFVRHAKNGSLLSRGDRGPKKS